MANAKTCARAFFFWAGFEGDIVGIAEEQGPRSSGWGAARVEDYLTRLRAKLSGACTCFRS